MPADPLLSERFDWYEPHQRWLRGEPGGARAVLIGADLARADLTRAVELEKQPAPSDG